MDSPRRTPGYSRRARSTVIELESAAKPPARFRLHRSAWIAWVVYAVISLGLIVSRAVPLEPSQFGELMGSVVVLLVVPTLLAWVAWRLNRRSAVVANVTFFVVFALTVTGEIVRFVRSTEISEKLAEQKRKAPPAKRVTQSAEAALKEERLEAAIAKAYREELALSQLRYEAAVKALNGANFWNLATFVPGESAEARRAAIKQFAQCNRELGTFQDVKGTAVQRILAQHGASPARVREGMADYLQSSGSRLPVQEKIRDADARLAQLMLEFLDFVESNRARWHVDAQGLAVFADQTLVTRYNELIKRATALSAEQADYQKQIQALTR